MPIWVYPADEHWRATREPLVAVTRDLTPGGIGLVLREFVDRSRLVLDLTPFAGEALFVATEVVWSASLGPYYNLGGTFIKRLATAPSRVEDHDGSPDRDG